MNRDRSIKTEGPYMMLLIEITHVLGKSCRKYTLKVILATNHASLHMILEANTIIRIGKAKARVHNIYKGESIQLQV